MRATRGAALERSAGSSAPTSILIAGRARVHRALRVDVHHLALAQGQPGMPRIPTFWPPDPSGFNYMVASANLPLVQFYFNSSHGDRGHARATCSSARSPATSSPRVASRSGDLLFLLFLMTLFIPFPMRMIPLYLLIRTSTSPTPGGRSSCPSWSAASASSSCASRCNHPRRPGRRGPPRRRRRVPDLPARSCCRCAARALATLAIISVLWRWNDVLWPLLVNSRRGAVHGDARASPSLAGPGHLHGRRHGDRGDGHPAGAHRLRHLPALGHPGHRDDRHARITVGRRDARARTSSSAATSAPGSCKALAMDASGAMVARGHASAIPVAHPQPGWARAGPARLDGGPRGVIADAGAPVGSGRVAAIGICGQVDGIVPVDGRMGRLGPALIWMDRRATARRPAGGALRCRGGPRRAPASTSTPPTAAPRPPGSRAQERAAGRRRGATAT